MFASISARRLNADPAPWVYPDGTRHATFTDPDHEYPLPDPQAIEYAPRAEFTPAQTLAVNPILNAARDSWDDADPWGSALGYLFPVCAALDVLGAQVPVEAGYRPSVAGAESDLLDGSWEARTVLVETGLGYALTGDTGGVDDDRMALDTFTDLDRDALAERYLLHAYRVLNRIADSARAAGLDY